MYQEQIGQPMIPQQSIPTEQSILVAAMEKFEKQNAHQTELVSKIQNELHKLLNRREPEKDGIEKGDPSVQDFYSALTMQLGKMNSNTRRLEVILSHLIVLV